MRNGNLPGCVKWKNVLRAWILQQQKLMIGVESPCACKGWVGEMCEHLFARRPALVGQCNMEKKTCTCSVGWKVLTVQPRL